MRTLTHAVRLLSTSIVTSAIVIGVLLGAQHAGAAPRFASLLSPPFAGPPPQMISYQGVVSSGGAPYDGTGYFKFAIVDSAGGDGSVNYWANDGTASGAPVAEVALNVAAGRFNVLLGDTTLAGMTQSLTDDDLGNTNAYLRVWFSATSGGPFEALEPNQRVASVAYALRSASADEAQTALSAESALMASSFATGAIVVQSLPVSFSLNPGVSTTYNVNCPTGTRALAGGIHWGSYTTGPYFDPNVETSYPVGTQQWRVEIRNRGTNPGNVAGELYAVCMAVQ